MQKLLALLLIATMPLAGVAQTRELAPALQQPVIDSPATTADFGAIPLWGTPDGRVLAMVSSGSAAFPTLPKSPQIGSTSEWRLIDVTSAVSASLLTRLADNTSARVDLSHVNVLSPLLAGEAGCVAGDAGCGRVQLAQAGALRVGLDWLASDNLDVDFSYGLAWLHRDPLTGDRPLPVYDSLAGVGNPVLPTLIVPGLDLTNATSTSIGGLGRLRVNDGNQVVDFGATLSRIQLSIPGSAPLTSLNQAAVSFGLEYGAFTGTATAHVIGQADIGPNSGNPHLTGLDVGLSWRTPWRGMFSVGAQNLWSSGSLPLAAPVAHDGDPTQARVPYVQYHQDL